MPTTLAPRRDEPFRLDGGAGFFYRVFAIGALFFGVAWLERQRRCEVEPADRQL